MESWGGLVDKVQPMAGNDISDRFYDFMSDRWWKKKVGNVLTGVSIWLSNKLQWSFWAQRKWEEKHAEKELSYWFGALAPASSGECLEKLRLINCRVRADWREVCGTAGVTSWLQTGVHGDQSRQDRNMAAPSLVHRQTGPKQTSCVWNRSSLTPTCSLCRGFYGVRYVASSSAEWKDSFRHYLDHSTSPLILHYYRTMQRVTSILSAFLR